MRNTDQAFNAPIPGESLTHAVGDRPWQTPPEYPTIEEALDFYLPRLGDRDLAARMIDIMERGVPITALAETITLGGVMQGLHTIDVAVLVNPVIVEFMEGLADIAGIKYRVGDTDGEDEPDRLIMSKVMKELKEVETESQEEPFELPDKKPEQEEEDKPVVRGLMARKETE